jgi:hypothetical protein
MSSIRKMVETRPEVEEADQTGKIDDAAAYNGATAICS